MIFHSRLFPVKSNGNFCQKNKRSPNFWALLPKYGQMRIFFKILTLSVFNDYWLLALCKKAENSNELFPRKIVRR